MDQIRSWNWPHDEINSLGLASSPDPDFTPPPQASSSSGEVFEAALCHTSAGLQVGSVYRQEMGVAKLSALNKMLIMIQDLSLSDGQTSVYDKIKGEPKGMENFVRPPPTKSLLLKI